ncbi:cation diffusion facilitator family transporter [Catenulispora pinisilvae]|uniref:cation diffusion facilitator family transporter n=1 Tax=Catenulispora pinisilvae TaxID=2705253 RepID=UPI0018926502|nr:cation diffusion facilitator family transporter [Catenulispora pinisilvae]
MPEHDPHDSHDHGEPGDLGGPGEHGHDQAGAPGHAGHSHGVAVDADRRWLLIGLALILGFMAVEVSIGFVAHSLALISDAAHMLTDAASILLALFAMRLAARPARGGYTFGLKRAEILSAQANGVTLLVLSAVLAFEAVRRLVSPPAVTGGLVLATALVGVAVNIAAAWSISKANRTSLNVEGAFQHILTDLYGFIATAIAGLVVLLTGFARADAIATLVVVALMLKAGLALVTAAGRIFLEAAPAGVDPDTVGDEMAAVEQVIEVHDLHIWEITSGQAALSAHVLVVPGGDCHKVRRVLQRRLLAEHGISHATLQVDHLGEEDDHQLLQIAHSAPGREQGQGQGHCEDAHGPVHRTGPHDH